MRCNQELYGHINCDRDVILGERYCKFHFVPSLRIEINKLQTENAKLRECVELISGDQEFYCEVGDANKQAYARQVLKELEDK